MKPDLQRRIQRYGWDKAAPYYETGWQDQLWQAQESLLSEADPRPGEQVLDISCGTGLVTFPTGEIIQPGGEVTGVDLSEGMIEIARQEKEEKEQDHISFLHMDAESLDFADDSFDLVICSLGMMYFPTPLKALKEMYRVLAPGGRAVVLVWGERSNCGWAEIFPIVDRRVKTDVCPLFFQQGTGDVLEKEFHSAGFNDTHTYRFSVPLNFKSDKQACIAAFLGGAVALAYQKFDKETKNEACQEYLASIQPYTSGQGYDIPGEFVITKGRKSMT